MDNGLIGPLEYPEWRFKVHKRAVEAGKGYRPTIPMRRRASVLEFFRRLAEEEIGEEDLQESKNDGSGDLLPRCFAKWRGCSGVAGAVKVRRNSNGEEEEIDESDEEVLSEYEWEMVG